MNRHHLVVGLVAAMCSTAARTQDLASVRATLAGFDTDEDAAMTNPASTRRLPVMSDMSNDQAADGNPLWGEPIEALHATRERPVFSASRRPPKPAVITPPVYTLTVAAPSAPPKPTFNLLGTVAGNGEGYAILMKATTNETVRLKMGEGEDGWILRSVSGREAILEKNDRTEVLELPPITGTQINELKVALLNGSSLSAVKKRI
jgi:hypothetical protein